MASGLPTLLTQRLLIETSMSEKGGVEVSPLTLPTEGLTDQFRNSPARKTYSKTFAFFLVTISLVLAAFAVALFTCRVGHGPSVACAPPTDIWGQAIPQRLARKQAEGQCILLEGRNFEPMVMRLGEPPPKGRLTADALAMLVVDMQPLFFDRSSPWGSREVSTHLSVKRLLNNQLNLGKEVMRATGRTDSVFLSKFMVPNTASESKGIMRHYYGLTPGWPNNHNVTLQALIAAGANTSYLMGLMPQLQPLLFDGAVSFTKPTISAFSRESALPSLLDHYFRNIGDRTRTLIIVGVETDYCILGTVLGALDFYYRVIIVTDAVGSSQPNSELAQFDYTFRRFHHMIDFATTSELIELLRA